MMQRLYGKHGRAIIVLSIVAMIQLILILTQEAIVDVADGVLHYQFARFSPQHPFKMFDHWAKPVFTMLAILPAQFGMKGIVFMNFVFGLVAMWLTYLSARALGVKYAFLAPLLIGLSNSVNYVVLGGLTEPTFMLAATAVLYTYIHNKLGWMYLILGSTLLIRPEAIVLIPVFGLFGILKGARVEVLSFFVVPVVISLLGMWIAEYEWSWIVTKQPYGGGNIYGYGTWGAYFWKWERISPEILPVLFFIGSILMFYRWKAGRTLLPTALVGAGIVALHVVLWKFGLMGSAGLARTLATALPFLVIIALYGGNFIPERRIKLAVWRFVVLYVLMALRVNDFPTKMSDRELAAKEMANIIKALPNRDTQLLAYQFATTAYYLDIDPFNYSKNLKLWLLPAQTEDGLSSGDYLLWDNVTGHREGKLPWEKIRDNGAFSRLDSVGVGEISLVLFQRK